MNDTQVEIFQHAGLDLLAAYEKVHAHVFEYLTGKLPRPESMKPDAYKRNLAARAFDVARYLLFFAVPTGVGQVVSIRTLERQISRMKGSEYAELRELADEMAKACAEKPDCAWDESSAHAPLAPTLAKYCDADPHRIQATADLKLWAKQNLPHAAGAGIDAVDLMKPTNTAANLLATLPNPVPDRPFRELYDLAAKWNDARRAEVIDVALQSRARKDDLLREFRGNLYVYDIVMDIGAYRDLHRHRRCQQFRQAYSGKLGYETPAAIGESGMADTYHDAMRSAFAAIGQLPEPGSHYLMPFGARSRFLFKMDFAEVEYISRLRSGVKGHFSYRNVAWRMKERMAALEPQLGRLIEATPPWIEDPLTR